MNETFTSRPLYGGRFGGRSLSLGFSLMELLVGIAIVGIGVALAVPSFTSILISNRLTATGNDYVAAFNAARLEAIRRNLPAQFCSNTASTNGSDTLGLACGTAAASVYALNSGGTTTFAVRNPTALPSSILLGNGSNGGSAMAALRYADTGIASAPGSSTPYTGLVVDVFSTKVSSANHRCIYMATGSAVSSCKFTITSGGCATSAPTTCPQ